MTFDRRIGSTAAEVPVKYQSDWTILNTNLEASRLYEILRKDVFSDIETGPRSIFHTIVYTNWPFMAIAFVDVWQKMKVAFSMDRKSNISEVLIVTNGTTAIKLHITQTLRIGAHTPHTLCYEKINFSNELFDWSFHKMWHSPAFVIFVIIFLCLLLHVYNLVLFKNIE